MNGMLKLRLFGSYATNLAMPWSDIDLVIINNRIKGFGDSNEVVMKNLEFIFIVC